MLHFAEYTDDDWFAVRGAGLFTAIAVVIVVVMAIKRRRTTPKPSGFPVVLFLIVAMSLVLAVLLVLLAENDVRNRQEMQAQASCVTALEPVCSTV